MRILGIESSCDETAAAVVTDKRVILSSIVQSQHQSHAVYGGVVPEIAARCHIENMEGVVRQALAEAQCDFSDLDAIAATTGPGLIGGVIVGTMTGKAFASYLKKPFIAINHLEGHALTARLSDNVSFPYLLLLVSGGHCQIIAVEAVGKYSKLGGTVDDALGEAFDKTAKLLGLGFPGGREVERHAIEGNPLRFTFPLPMKGRAGCDFSFSGLKTAVRLKVQELRQQQPLSKQDTADICASFQYTTGEILKDRIGNAIAIYNERYENKNLVVAGGVAANLYLRGILGEIADKAGFSMFCPPIALCTDNAAMIAWAGMERLWLGLASPLTTEPRARWALTEF